MNYPVTKSCKLQVIVIGCAAIAGILLAGCKSVHNEASALTEIGPAPDVRVSLMADGLPQNFFLSGADTECASQIVGYRFVVWLDNDHVAVGFNTSPSCRSSPNQRVQGLARILVFNVKGNLKASRDLPYEADGNGELVTPGEASPGPGGTLLFRIEGVNGTKSAVLLLDSTLKDVARFDRFLEQTALEDHALVFQDGFTLSGPRTYSVFDGAVPKLIEHRQVEWPAGAMDRKFGEHGFAFMLCGQEFRPGTYTYTNVVHAGVKFRCALNAQGEDGSVWTSPLKDGETATIIDLLSDGSVVGQVYVKGSNAGRLVVWKKEGSSDHLPWLPSEFAGTVDSASRDFSRYASFATNDARPCNPIARLLGTACDEGGNGRWFVFDRKSKFPVVNRVFLKGGRADLSPDGLRYASFESDELRIYPLPDSK